MSSSRVEYVIAGVFVEELPFEDDEEHMPYTCHMENESVWAVRLFSCDDDNPGFVIGRVISRTDSECACSVLTEIPQNIDQITYQAYLDLTTRLEMDIEVKEVKLYTFTVWN